MQKKSTKKSVSAKKRSKIPYEKTKFHLDGVAARSIIDEMASERDESIIVLDGLDEAIVGYHIDEDCLMHVVYSVDRCIEVFMKRDGMSYEDALDFYTYNTERTIPYTKSHGNTPIMLNTIG